MPTSFRLNGFRDMSIQRQYALILLLTVGSILLIVDVALIGIQWHMAHDQLLKQVHAEAKIIAVSVVASLSSNNHQTAENILHGVESETSIETAMLYDRNGEPFATYQRSGVSFPPHISVPLEYRYTFQDGYLNLFQPVALDGTTLGVVQLRSSLSDLYKHTGWIAATALMLTILALFAADVISVQSYRLIYKPVLYLEQLMRKVSKEKDFSLRAMTFAQDEAESLTMSFNELLTAIETRIRKLSEARQYSDELLVERTTALNESEQRYRLLFEQAPICIAITDIEGRFILVNPASAKLVHAPNTEGIIGQTVWDFIHPESIEEIRTNWQRAVRTMQTVVCVEHKLLCVDGTIAYAECNIIPFYEQGILRIQIVVPDRTEQKTAEIELRRYAESLEMVDKIDRAILAVHSPEAIAAAALKNICHLLPCIRTSVSLMDFTTNEGVILAVEGAGAKELGANTRFPLDSVFGQFDALKHGEIHRVDDVAAISMPSELQVLVEKGIRSYINIPLVVQGELLGTLNIGADVTEAFTAEDMNIAWEIADSLAIAIQQARLYQQVQKHAQDLEQRVAERTAELTTTNKELERFGYSVSHDLRAPLRGINGFSMALIEDYGAILDEEGRDYLKRIRAATLRMGQLIDDLLNLARVTRTEMVRQTIDLSAIARSIADNFQKEQPDRRVEVHIQEGAVIHGDVLLMTVVLQNLLDNAWKFTSKHKHAHIEFGFRDEANERVIYVRDDGAGFDMAYKDKLFYPFERLHTPQEFEGSGVGLATVRRIIERHGGRVWAEGEIDKGATVWFSVPIQKH